MGAYPSKDPGDSCNTDGQHIYGDFYAYSNKNYAGIFKTTFVGQGAWSGKNPNNNLMEDLGKPPNFVYDSFDYLENDYGDCNMKHTCYVSNENRPPV